MRLLLTAIVALSMTSAASAFTLIAGDEVEGTNYKLTASAPEVVGTTSGGEELVRVIIAVENISGNADLNANVIGGDAVVGSNGNLHHDQAGFGTIATPTLDSIVALGQGGSLVDSHFIAPVRLDNPGTPVAEEALFDLGADDTGITSVFPPIPPFTPAGATGFGASLSGGFAFGTASDPADATTELLQLVVRNLPGDPLSEVDLRLTIGNPDPSVPGELFEGTVVLIPEPSTVMLAGLALVGFAARRRS